MADALDLNSLLQQSLDTAGNYSDLHDQVAGQVAIGNQANETRQRLASQAADASEVVTQTKLEEVARQEAGRKAIAARLGMDPSAAGYKILQASKDGEEADQGLAQASAAIRDKNSINPILNPLGWVAAKMTVNSDIENYNFYARQKNRAEQTAADAVKETEDSFRISDALSSTVSEQFTNASKVLGAYNYNMQAQEAAAQGARWNLEGIMHSAQLDKDRLSILYSANSAQMQEKQYQAELQRLRLATQEFGLHQQQFGLQQAEFNLRKKAADEKTGDEAIYLKYLQDGHFALTGKQMDPATNSQALALLRTKNPTAMAWFEAGLESSAVTGGQSSRPVISLSPFKAADLVSTGKTQNLSPSMAQVGEQLITWRRSFENPQVQQNPRYQFDPKEKGGKEAAFNKFVYDQSQNTLNGNQQGTVYAPAGLEQVASVNKNFQDMPIWTKVLAPALKTKANINDPNVAFGLVTSAVREGVVSYQDAADLSTMYAAALDLTNQSHNFMAFGLPKAMTYNNQVNVPGTFGKTKINFADGNSFKTALNRASAFSGLSYATENRGVLPTN